MPKIKLESPKDIVKHLNAIFPLFDQKWRSEQPFESYGYDENNFSAHCVFLVFGSWSFEFLEKATKKQLKTFGRLIDHLIEMGGDFENSVSTCFLEHATQIGVAKIVRPYLSAKSQKRIR